MRSREFVTEAKALPVEISDPLPQAYDIPDLDTSNPYKVYRFGLAMARARSDARDDGTNPYRGEWHPHSVAGEYAMVVGTDPTLDLIIDQGLKLAEIPGGKRAISSPGSQEPSSVDTQSPLKAFKGYPR